MCGLIGIISNKNDVPIKLYEGLTYLQHRGQDSVGICNEQLCIKKKGLVKEVFTEDDLDQLKSNIGIGHVRYGTTGSFEDIIIQPLIREYPKRISLCHNGNINNLKYISEIIQKTHLKSDSEYILELFLYKLKQLCNYKPAPTDAVIYNYENNNNINLQSTKIQNTEECQITSSMIFEIMDYMMDILNGSYSVLILIEGFGMICFRDKFGIRPLVYGIYDNTYVISSETVAVDVLGFQFVRDLNPGETIIFEQNNMPRFSQYKNNSLHPCLFEYIYFSRIDSIMDGISIYDARYNLGKLLGERIKQMNIQDIDIIVPVPDSSLIFALGLHEILNINIQYGLVKNPYIERTFIMKDNKIINQNIKRKLNGVKTILQNKNVLIVDDSIVRGNTSAHIVLLAKKMGANKIYMASGAPPVLYKNIYGIYIPDQTELIAYNRNFQNIADIIGANKVIYNDLNEVVTCLKKMNPNIVGFETSMFNNVHLF